MSHKRKGSIMTADGIAEIIRLSNENERLRVAIASVPSELSRILSGMTTVDSVTHAETRAILAEVERDIANLTDEVEMGDIKLAKTEEENERLKNDVAYYRDREKVLLGNLHRKENGGENAR